MNILAAALKSYQDKKLTEQKMRDETNDLVKKIVERTRSGEIVWTRKYDSSVFGSYQGTQIQLFSCYGESVFIHQQFSSKEYPINRKTYMFIWNEICAVTGDKFKVTF